MTIVKLLQLRNRLSREKSITNRKLFIVNNLINTSRSIENFGARQRASEYWRTEKKINDGV
jgi:hypothetical protein